MAKHDDIDLEEIHRKLFESPTALTEVQLSEATVEEAAKVIFRASSPGGETELADSTLRQLDEELFGRQR